MLEAIKTALRISHSSLDSDIEANIAAGLLELVRAGVSKEKAVEASEDPLIYKAVELYVKWQYDFQSKGDKFQAAFEKLRDALSLCDDYKEE